MSTESLSMLHPTRTRSLRTSWLGAKAVWAGLAIAVMWLAVLFVGVFGGDLVTHSSSGDGASIPVVVLLLPFVLPASISASRHGFSEPGPTDGLRRALEEEIRAREELTEVVSELHTKLS